MIIKFIDFFQITLGSIWLCVTGLLTNEDQQNSITIETRTCALKCVLELIKIDVSLRNFNTKVRINVLNLLIDDEVLAVDC